MMEVRAGGMTFAFGGVTHVMAVINLSPESRNPQSVAAGAADALAMARRYRAAGATLIDLGAQSSHFEAPTLTSSEEIDRLLPALELLVADGHAVSVDTWKPAVAEAAVHAGAAFINDTGGMSDPAMRDLIARSGVGTVVVYVEGENPHAVGEVMISDRKAAITREWFADRLAVLTAGGIDRTIIDPGIALNYRGNYEAYTRMQMQVIRDTPELASLGRPVLIPIPRKKELARTVAYVTLALEYGADMIRVHDVAEACDLVALFDRTAPAPLARTTG